MSSLLLVGCAALAGVIALELSEDISIAPDVTAAAPPTPEIEEAVVEPFEPPPPDRFTVISERPLFVPSRRPFVPPPEVEPAGGPSDLPLEPLTAELVGVMVMGSGRAALIQPEDSSVPRRMSVGQSIDGWRIEEVEPGHAVFRRGEEEQTLELRRD